MVVDQFWRYFVVVDGVDDGDAERWPQGLQHNSVVSVTTLWQQVGTDSNGHRSGGWIEKTTHALISQMVDIVTDCGDDNQYRIRNVGLTMIGDDNDDVGQGKFTR